MIEHCCKDMRFFINENKVAINYNKKFRGYYINLKYSGGKQQIFYCPWCGCKTPKVLYKEYNNYLCNALDIPVESEIIFDQYFDSNLPEEFKTDEWWKKRGL